MPSTKVAKMFRAPLVAMLVFVCVGAIGLAPEARAQGSGVSGIDRSEVVGEWEGVLGTGARSATLLQFRLSLKTGLEASAQEDLTSIEIDEEQNAAMEEARARMQAIRDGRDPETAVRSNDKAERSEMRRAETIERARLTRERSRADRVEGVMEFSPLYGEGKIRVGLGGVPSVADGSGTCEVVGYLDSYSGALTLSLTRWTKRPKTNLLQSNELQLVIDPSEPVLFGESRVVGFAASGSFRPVIAWREGRAPAQEIERIEGVAYPNQFGGTRVTHLRQRLSEYNRVLHSIERRRPEDTIDADYASKYANAESRLESELASNKKTYERTIAGYDKQEADLDAQESAGDLTDSQRRRIASKRESIAKRRVKALEQHESRNESSRERYANTNADLDERVVKARVKYEQDLAKHEGQLAELNETRSDVRRSITINNDTLAEWVDHIEQHHPQVRSDRGLEFTSPGARHALQNAMRDDAFVSAFGAPFDELTDFDVLLLVAYLDMRNEVYDDEGEIETRTGASASPPRDRGRVRQAPSETPVQPPAVDPDARNAQREAQRELLGNASRAIKDALVDDYERSLLRLYVQRRLRNWIDRVERDVDEMQPDAETFKRLDAIERTLAIRSHSLRPSEQDAALLIVIQARRAYADATALHLADATLDQAQGQAGIAALSYFWAREPALDRLVSAGARGVINEKIEAGLDRAIIGIVQDLRGRLSGLDKASDPYDALAIGAGVYRDFLSQIGAAKRRPEAKKVLEAIAARRPADLGRVQQEISTRILAASTAADAERIASEVVSLPSDAQTDAGKAILQNVSLRKLQLEAEALRALFSEREWSLLDKDRGRLVVPRDYSAPSAEEVRLATLRTLASDGGEVLDPFTCMHVVPGLGNLNVKLRMELLDVQIVKVSPRGDGGYDVLYNFRRQITPEGSLTYLANDDFWQGTLLLDMLDAFGDNLVESALETFRLGPFGWYSPTLSARLDLASAMQPLRVLTGERRDR